VKTSDELPSRAPFVASVDPIEARFQNERVHLPGRLQGT
jgi:hypothetical protein